MFVLECCWSLWHFLSSKCRRLDNKSLQNTPKAETSSRLSAPASGRPSRRLSTGDRFKLCTPQLDGTEFLDGTCSSNDPHVYFEDPWSAYVHIMFSSFWIILVYSIISTQLLKAAFKFWCQLQLALQGFPPTTLRRRLLWHLGCGLVWASVVIHPVIVSTARFTQYTKSIALTLRLHWHSHSSQYCWLFLSY